MGWPLGHRRCDEHAITSSHLARTPSIPPPPRPPMTLDSLVAWVEDVPDLALRWSKVLPRTDSSYVWSQATRRGTILLPQALESCPRECKCTLAHEIGHHFTLRVCNGYPWHRSMALARNESLARRIAVALLVPGDRVQRLSSARLVDDLCDEWDVMPDVVEMVMWMVGAQ